MEEFNQTAAPYAKDKCIHELFEEQAASAPEAVALEFEGQSLTYQEVNQRANQLAHHLRALGVGPEERVGICVERGFEMIIGLLAVRLWRVDGQIFKWCQTGRGQAEFIP